MKRAWMVCACLLAGAMGAAAAEGGWEPLFNGKDMEGWTCGSKDKFSVEDGCIVGTQSDGKGDDLYTAKEYDNFELRVVYRVVWPANSGIWFRTNAGNGYQFDILKYANPVAYSGTLYCPGKLFIFKNLDESLENRDGWNQAQIYANGDRLIHWLNGKKVGECTDKTFAKGRIGIQVHGGEMKGMKIFVKTIEIRALKPGDEPTPPAAPAKDAKEEK
jgi:hypothetical protein